MRALAKATASVAIVAGLLTVGCETTPVTERRQLVLIDASQAAEMGAQAYQQILAKSEISQDRALNQRVQRVGQRVAQAVDGGSSNWEFTLIEDATPNAFALPGGKVGIHTGLFQVVENEDQLAAIIGHEIAHVTARHSSERLSRQLLVQGGLTGLGAASESQGLVQLAAAAAQLGIVLPFSRSQEAEADEIGLHYMARAGYDPRAALEVWENFRSFGGARPPEFLSTHPSPDARLERIRNLIPEVMPIYRSNAGRS